MARSPLPRATRQPPRLVLRFAVFMALGLGLATAAIVLLVRQEATTQAQQHAIDRTRFATEAVLKHELRPADLKERPSTARRQALDRLFRESVLLEGILHVTLYSADGRPTYSTGGRNALVVPVQHFQEALGGVALSDAGASRRDGRMLRTYIPVVVGAEGAKGLAAFEQDYAPVAAAARRSTWLIAGVLEGLLLVLFLIFGPVLVRVTSRIRGQIAEIERAATHDELTGTSNRVALRSAVERRLATGKPGALLLLDVDGFSEMNHAFGSDGGDVLLREIALCLRWELADCDLVARTGEDEFAVLLDVATPGEIAAIAKRARFSLEPPLVVDGVRVAVSVSMGAAILGEHGTDFAAVLRRAGAALSVAKEEGRDEVAIYEPSHEARDVSRVTIVAELREALQAGELLVHYQPQADLATRHVRAVEALVRWQHPTRGLLTANAFVPSAERSGVAKELRQFVLESSIGQWHEWSRLGLELELAVNLSAVDMHDVTLPDEIALLVERYGMPPWNLVLEMTERTLVGDERRTQLVIERLREIGVRLAVDDFGTGYSSLASLRRFPVQIVKLDRSLLADVPGEPAAEAVVSGSIELAHAIGATVVAEGVETREQWAFVKAVGCDIAQGYLVGRPVPPDEIVELLQRTPAVTPRIVAA